MVCQKLIVTAFCAPLVEDTAPLLVEEGEDVGAVEDVLTPAQALSPKRETNVRKVNVLLRFFMKELL